MERIRGHLEASDRGPHLGNCRRGLVPLYDLCIRHSEVRMTPALDRVYANSHGQATGNGPTLLVCTHSKDSFSTVLPGIRTSTGVERTLQFWVAARLECRLFQQFNLVGGATSAYGWFLHLLTNLTQSSSI